MKGCRLQCCGSGCEAMAVLFSRAVFFIGLIILALGIGILMALNQLNYIFFPTLQLVGLSVFWLGSFIALTPILASSCCSRRNGQHGKGPSLFLFLVTIVEIVLLIGSIQWTSDELYGEMRTDMERLFQKVIWESNGATETGAPSLREFNRFQGVFKCCGVTSYRDWEPDHNRFDGAKKIPSVCCDQSDWGGFNRYGFKNGTSIQECDPRHERNMLGMERGCHYILYHRTSFILVGLAILVGIVIGLQVLIILTSLGTLLSGKTEPFEVGIGIEFSVKKLPQALDGQSGREFSTTSSDTTIARPSAPPEMTYTSSSQAESVYPPLNGITVAQPQN